MNINALAIPGAIVLAGVIIAGAVIFSSGGFPTGSDSAPAASSDKQATEQFSGFRPVTKEDHIRGSINADVFIIEYSDTECPFCKRFHSTLQQIMDEYEKSGQVAWVYRHFPIPQLHSKAEQEAVATECAAELGGNDSFWAYTDRIYEITPSNNGLDLNLLPEIAEEIGLNRSDFEACLVDEDESILDKIRTDRDEAIATGGRGTPHSLVIIGNKIFPIQGAQPFETVKATIEQALDSL